ncbi:MAG: GAF domain-containing protein [Tannerellaceae bacterium]|jgi:GAF domain-containing protein|nr:GAF domain-containing protein [Tannerellaceae bacterium]
MSEELSIPCGTKAERYSSLLPQLKSLLDGEPDAIANMSNTAAALKQAFGFLWVGFYIVRGSELVLGPFQGPVACTRIGFGKGVCGTSWSKKQTVVVPDVEQYPGHIACSSSSRSEIVVPLLSPDGTVAAVLDIDSDTLGTFDDTDARFLGEIADLLMRGTILPN